MIEMAQPLRNSSERDYDAFSAYRPGVTPMMRR
jgi:hypothetical protein